MNDTTLLNQALQLHAAGKLQEAEVLYRKVLAVLPGNLLALANLGVIANQVGKFEIASDFFRRALVVAPRHVESHTGLGNALSGMGRCGEAIECYRRAISFTPDHVEAYYNMSLALTRLDLLQESVEALRHVVRLRPNAHDAYNALGSALDSLGEPAQAIEAYKNAIRVKPDFALAYNNLGNTFLAAAFPDKAVECYRAAIQHKPDFVEALFNLGNALIDLKREADAITAFKTVVAIRPELTEAHFNLTRAQQHLCDWTQTSASNDAFLAYMYANPGRVDPFFLLSQNSTHADQLLCAQHFAKRHAVPASRMFTHAPRPEGRKLRIGYISGNFHQHPNSYLSVGMFEEHDRERFEVFGYSYGPDDGSPVRKRVEASFDKFIDIQQLTYAQAAKRIHDDGIDILVDRQGYTTRHRMGIAAYKPAPVQVNYLGFPGTMGADYLDYIIVDPFVVSPDQQPFFTEKLVYLPDCYQSTDSRQDIAPHIPSRAECGLPEKGFVFCCFNNNNKLRPEFFDIWMRLLNQVPGSVLWLLRKNALVESNLRREAAARGIDPERIVFAPHMPHAEHLARQKRADLFLDTLPYNAHTTASDALWSGLPVLTCVGQTFSGRVAGSVLMAANLPELITYSIAEYEKLALALAQKPRKLAAIRKKLGDTRLEMKLFNTQRYTRNMEEAYLRMWELWQAGEGAQPIMLNAA